MLAPRFSQARRSLSSLSHSSPHSHPAPASPPSPSPPLLSFYDYTAAQLAAQLLPLGVPAYRATQLFHFVYRKGALSFDAMSSLSTSLRRHLASCYSLALPPVLSHTTSTDGTRKLLLSLPQSASVESVFIPKLLPPFYSSSSNGTLCLSSQTACSLRCAFCATGAMDKSKLRNLRPAEIIGQVLQTLHSTGDYAAALPAAHSTAHTPGVVSNIVFMGMGEPGYNMRAVLTALSILSDHHGLGFGARRITVSTSGVVPAMDRLRDAGVRLAVSLHAVTDELRDRLVPINRTWGIDELMKACQRFQGGVGSGERDGRRSRGRITFEYVLLDGVNDSVAEARELTRLLRSYRIEALINIIPFNPVSGTSRAAVWRSSACYGVGVDV